jgi:hypothetical protein
MANTFTISRSFPFGNTHNKELVRVHGTLVVDTAAGAEQGDFPATLFGLYSILNSGPAISSSGLSLYATSPDENAESMMAFGAGAAAGAATDLAAETYKVWVEGTK